MAEMKGRQITPAQAIIDQRIEAALQEPIDWPWPNNVAFVPADMDGAGRSVIEYAREGRNVVIVYGDGSEVVLTQPQDPAERG
jgi:hypothetical protein